MYQAVENPPELCGTDICPNGTVWVCAACGKTAKSKYGFDKDDNRTNISCGWDESCMMNSVLCKDPDVPKD